MTVYKILYAIEVHV